MPVNSRDIADALKKSGLSPAIEDESIVVAGNFELDGTDYRNPEGKPEVKVIVDVKDDGSIVSVLALDAWIPEGNRPKAYSAFAKACCKLDLVRFHISPLTGGICPQVQIPVLDSNLTGAQLAEAIARVLDVVKSLDHVVRDTQDDIKNKPGATPGRLVALAAFHQWLDEIKKKEGNKEKRDGDEPR